MTPENQAAARERFTLDEIQQGYAELYRNVECVTCARLLAYVKDLLALLQQPTSSERCGECEAENHWHRTACSQHPRFAVPATGAELCNVSNPGGLPCSKSKGHDGGHDLTAYGPPTGEDEPRDVCWHCKVVLSSAPKPRCEDCPDECDVEGCDADGCATSPAPVAEGEYVFATDGLVCAECGANFKTIHLPLHEHVWVEPEMPSTVTTSEVAREAARELSEVGYLDCDLFVKVSEARLEKVAAIISKHIDAGEVERLKRDRDFLQEVANGLRAELSTACANAIREAVSKCEEQQIALGEGKPVEWDGMDQRDVWNAAVIHCAEGLESLTTPQKGKVK